MNYFATLIRQSAFWTIFDTVKSSIAIVFIFLLSAQSIFKLSIVAYFEANRDYIAEVLCINKQKEITTCHGKCFLNRNLAIANEESPTQLPANDKKQFENSLFIATDINIVVAKYSRQLDCSTPPQELYSLDPLHSFFHPPC